MTQWAREQRRAEQDRESDFGPDDYFEGALRGGHHEDNYDEFGETMLLVGLCLAVSVLLYVRTRLIERMRREGREADGRENGNGNGGQQPAAAFPQGPEPPRDGWVI